MSLLHIHPPVIAHRGASAYAPENTMLAFTKAAQLGIKWIEFDVMQTSDGALVIFHDETLDRIAQVPGKIVQSAYAYLHTLDVGKWFTPIFSGEKIPDLSQVTEFLSQHNMSANIEIKATETNEEQVVKRILQEVEKTRWSKKSTILYSSFSLRTLQFLRQHAPHALIGLLLDEWLIDWQKICTSLHCVSVHVNHEILTCNRAQEIKAMGKMLLCYTVNDVKRAQELFSWGVDAVFSDVPDKILG